MTHKLWPTVTTERLLGYAFAIVLTTQVSLVVAVQSEFTTIVRAFAVATTLQIILIPILFDVIIHDILLPAPKVRIVAAAVAAVWNVILLIGWGVVGIAYRKDGNTMFGTEQGTTWTLFVGYLTNAVIMVYWIWQWWQTPYERRVHWTMRLGRREE